MEDYPADFFRVNTWLIKLAGLHFPKSGEGLLRTAAYYSYNVFWVLYCQVYYTTSELLALEDTVKKPSDLIEHIGMLTTHLVGTFKIFILGRNMLKIKRLKGLLEAGEFQYESLPDFAPAAVVKANRRVFHINALFFFTVASFVPISKFCEAIYVYVRVGDLDSSNVTCKDVLPYFSRFPFDVEKHCTLALVVQYFPMQFYVFQIVCYDLQFTSLCLCIRAHLVNIRGAFRTIRPRCLRSLHLPDDYTAFRDTDNPKLSQLMEKEIRRVTIHLQAIIEACNEMEDIFTFGTLAQAMVTLFAMVSCFYIMSYEPLFSATFIAELDYVGGVLIQLTFCCAYGNEITITAQNVIFGIYDCDWFAATNSFKHSMIMNMRRLQKPIVLTIGKFYPLTLTALISVIRGGFSYVAVLRQTT